MQELTTKQAKIFIAALLNTENFDKRFTKIGDKEMLLEITKYGDFSLHVITKEKIHKNYIIEQTEFYEFYGNI